MTRTAKRSAGFTLIELLVVMSIMALVMAAALAAKPKVAAIRVSSVARSIADHLRLARAQAMLRNSETVFRFDLGTRQFGLPNSMHDLPKGMTVVTTIAEGERHGSSGNIRFYSDGQSSGGQILLMLDGRTARIEVSWLTGEPQLGH